MMHNKWTSVTPLLLAAVLILGMSLMAFAANSGKQELASVTTNPYLGWFDGNRIFSYMENNGSTVSYHYDGNSGMYWPSRESLLTINFAAGVWVSGLVEGIPRTACAEYSSEWTPGMVLPDGTPDNSNDPKYKLYKINKLDAADPQSNDDWMNWPVDQGAPWIDANGNGIYEPLSGDTPDIIGDQMIWYVMNDLNLTAHDNVFSSAPIGLECRVTIWGYDRPDEFGDMMFSKFQLFNRQSTTINDAFLGMWSDIDLGNGSDDFAGCDTVLSLGYVYNDGPDNMYGAACPAIGNDFFQGAIVASPGDTAKAFGRMIPDYKNLGMDVFINYIRGDASLPDPESAQECYNYMSGLRNDGTKFVDPITNQEVYPAKVFGGDPVAGTGWVDAIENTSGDRRILQTCGPFTISPGDSQEVVTACLIAQGSDHLNSITRLKQADVKAQTAYDIDFKLPESPPSPDVKVITMDGEIVLIWGDNAESYVGLDQVDTDTSGNPTTYNFEGYNVYQYETNLGQGAVKKLATYDVIDGIKEIKDNEFVSSIGEVVDVTVQSGNDTGLQHSIVITNDALRGNQPIVNNRPFYFLVSAYAYNENGIPKTLESSKSKDKILVVYPQQPFGVRLNAQTGDDSTIVVAHTSGGSQGVVSAEVVAPTEITGDDYEVRFYEGESGILWKLVDTTTGETVLADQAHQGFDDSFLIVDGLMVKVAGPEPGMYAVVEVANPSFAWPDVPEDEQDASGEQFGGNAIWHSLGFPDDVNHGGRLFLSSQGDFLGDLTRQHDYEIRFVGTESWAYSLTTYAYFKVPFELWDVGDRTYSDTSDDERMAPVTYSAGGTPELFDMPNGDEVDSYFGLPCSDRIYFYYIDDGVNNYDSYAAALEAGDTGAADYMWGMTYARPYARIVIGNYDNYLDPDTYPPDIPADGTIFRFISNKSNQPDDVFAFSTAGLDPTSSDALAKDDIKKINVFPNPYFGANVEEVQPLVHFVRFTHLPKTGVTLRIYNLAGDLVRTIEHDNNTQFEEWNLQNTFDIPVASGMYIVHVDCGELGEKILKLALILPEERLRAY